MRGVTGKRVTVMSEVVIGSQTRSEYFLIVSFFLLDLNRGVSMICFCYLTVGVSDSYIG